MFVWATKAKSLPLTMCFSEQRQWKKELSLHTHTRCKITKPFIKHSLARIHQTRSEKKQQDFCTSAALWTLPPRLQAGPHPIFTTLIIL